MPNRLSKIFSLALLFLPMTVFAGTFDDLIASAFTWLSLLVYVVMGIAMLLFFWGIIKYVMAGATNEEGRTDARNLIVYGIIGLFVMVTIWGLVYFLAGTFGIGIGGTTAIPGLPSPGGLEGAPTETARIIGLFGKWIARIAVLLISFAVVAFFWGLTKYIASGADEEKRSEARNLITYGVVGLFVMISIWGLVYFVGDTLGIDINNSSILQAPQITDITVIDNGQGGKPITVTGEALTGSSCADASWTSGKRSFLAFVCLILSILNPIPPILLALAVLYFFWGIAKYMNSGDDSEKLREGRTTMVYGILGLFVIVALWGLVLLVKSELGIV